MSSRLRVAPVVEGKGEDGSVRTLLQRIWTELLGGEYIDSLKPIRHPSDSIKQRDGLRRAVGLALKRLFDPDRPPSPDPALVLVLVDADDDCPKDLGPRLLSWAREVDGRANIACVVINVEYETWFVAAAESLAKIPYLQLGEGDAIPDDPEGQRSRSAWIERRFRDRHGSRFYKKKKHQPGMTAAMDLDMCRGRCPSFDKLCRELEKFTR